jgi:hypothetical protein
VQHSVTTHAAFTARGTMPYCTERRLNRVDSSDAFPMLRREILKYHQLVSILLQAYGGFVVFGFVRFKK